MLDSSQKFQSKVFVFWLYLCLHYFVYIFYKPQPDDALKSHTPFHQLHLAVSLFKMNLETSVNE